MIAVEQSADLHQITHGPPILAVSELKAQSDSIEPNSRLNELLQKLDRWERISMLEHVLAPELLHFDNDAAAAVALSNAQRQRSRQINHLLGLQGDRRIRIESRADRPHTDVIAVPRHHLLNMLVRKIPEMLIGHGPARNPSGKTVPAEIDQWTTEYAAIVIFRPCDPVVGLIPHISPFLGAQPIPPKRNRKESKVAMREFPERIATSRRIDSDADRRRWGCLRPKSPLQEDLGMRNRQPLRGPDCQRQRCTPGPICLCLIAGHHGRRKQAAGFFPQPHCRVRLIEVNHHPFFGLVNKHGDAVASQLHGQDIGNIARWKKAGAERQFAGLTRVVQQSHGKRTRALSQALDDTLPAPNTTRDHPLVLVDKDGVAWRGRIGSPLGVIGGKSKHHCGAAFYGGIQSRRWLLPKCYTSRPDEEPHRMQAAPNAPVTTTNLPLQGKRQGKVRDIYEVPATAHCPPQVLIIATDRISAFDVVMPTPVPGKGQELTAISTKWFDMIRSWDLIPDHLKSTEPADVAGMDASHTPQLQGRMMLGRAARVIPVEFVVRGYITGSGWKEYQQSGTVCGIPLPEGLRHCEQLPEPIFTPATKADEGHDENIDFETACSIAGRDVMNRLRDVSVEIYRRAAEYARERGIILADTKFEFGYALDADGNETDEIMLIDEVLTPDSSRFWPAEDYEVGRDQDSFDKQYVRNHLEGLVQSAQWDKTPPGPALPDDVVVNTLSRYREAHRRLFG